MLKAALKSCEDREKELAKVVYPKPPMDRGHYDARMRFMIMKLISLANLCPSRVPMAYEIISEYHGIQFPVRARKVVAVRRGLEKPRYEKRTIVWRPCEATCEAIRCEMGCMSQLQVGEYIIDHGGTEGNFAIHSDGANSEGRELSGYVGVATDREPSQARPLRSTTYFSTCAGPWTRLPRRVLLTFAHRSSS